MATQKPMHGPRGKAHGPKPKVKNPGKLFKRLMGYVFKKYKIHCIVVFICIVVGVLASVQGTMFLQTLIDDYISPMIGVENPDFSPLAKAMARVACYYVLGAGAAYLQGRLMVIITQGTLKSLRDDMFIHMQSLPIKYFDTHPHGDVMSVFTNDIDTLRQMISQSIPQIINSVFTIVSVFVCMISINLPLTAITVVMVAVMLFSAKYLAGKSGKYFVEQQKNLGKVNGFNEEMMEGQKVVKVFSHEKKNIEDFNELNNELFDSAYKANKFVNILGPVNAQLGNISYVICAITGGILVGFTGLTVGGLASFLKG